MKALADNLYFRNLDNDAGVFHHLIDGAEEEEVKEALLGWYFPRVADRPLTVAELDDTVEAWMVDGGRLEAVPVGQALRRLDARWDRYFECERPEGPR